MYLRFPARSFHWPARTPADLPPREMDMTPRPLRTIAGLTVALLLAHAAGAGPERPSAAKPAPRDVAFFEKEVVPLLKANCLKCHGAGKTRGGLRLTSREAVLEGGDTGPAISLDQPDQSLLLKAVRHQNGLEMPPRGKLPPKDLDTLTRWVHAGLPWTPGAADVAEAPAEERPDRRRGTELLGVPAGPARPAVPTVRDTAWVRTPVDAFILAKLEAKGLTPGRAGRPRRPGPPGVLRPDRPAADAGGGRRLRRTTARRTPTRSSIDRLLASPHYGEKWGRHWLDLVRYAETNGYERDGPKPFAWRYRDYVIRSFNADKPYDRFVREQLAGDEMPGDDPDAVIATGYYRLGLWDDEPADRAAGPLRRVRRHRRPRRRRSSSA